MTAVQTVTGPIDPAELGRTLVHEHIRISWPGEELDRSYSWDRADTVSRAVDKMAELLDAGFRTFVDPCPIELGRDPELYAEISEQSGMRIVCTTGFYTEHGGSGLPYYWRGPRPRRGGRALRRRAARGDRRHRDPSGRDQGGHRARGHRRRAPDAHGRRARTTRHRRGDHHAHRELAARRRATGHLRLVGRRPRTRAHRSPGRAGGGRADPQARRARHVRGHRPYRPRAPRTRRTARRPRRHAGPRGSHVARVPVTGPHLHAHRTAERDLCPPGAARRARVHAARRSSGRCGSVRTPTS